MSLTDNQYLVLDILMRAQRAGIDRLSRKELLYGTSLPLHAACILTFAALVMPKGLLVWHNENEFSISPAGEEAYLRRFGCIPESETGDSVLVKATRH